MSLMRAPAPGQGGHRAERIAIQRAELTLEVDDVAKAAAAAAEIADARGGFAENQTVTDERTGWVSLRVPAERLDESLAALAGLGREKSRSVSSEDVTEQYLDLETRLRNARELRDRLRALLAKGDDGDGPRRRRDRARARADRDRVDGRAADAPEGPGRPRDRHGDPRAEAHPRAARLRGEGDRVGGRQALRDSLAALALAALLAARPPRRSPQASSSACSRTTRTVSRRTPRSTTRRAASRSSGRRRARTTSRSSRRTSAGTRSSSGAGDAWTVEQGNASRFVGTALCALLCDGAGLTLATALPREAILALASRPYEACSGWILGANDCLATKGFLHARILLGGEYEVHFVNTHLDAGRAPEDRAARAAELAQLRAYLEREAAGAALVLGGDLNLDAANAEDAALRDEFARALGLADTGAAAADGEPWTKLDYLYHRDGGAVVLELLEAGEAREFVDDAGAPLSDHPALFARLRARPAF